jgi:GH24 family phage-related lysozyme (muramidase)
VGKTERYILFAAAGLMLAAYFFAGVPGSATTDMDNLLINAGKFIASNEGFVDHPYWDVSRYSWGYGTAAPGPTGTISPDQAMNDLLDHAQNDYDRLLPQVSRNLTANQWIAYLDFSYNEGVGNAENLLDDLNSGNDAVLETHWKKYIYAGGVTDDRLVTRRNKEWDLFTT